MCSMLRRIRTVTCISALCALWLFAVLLGSAYAQTVGASLQIAADSPATLSVDVKKVQNNAIQPDGIIYWSVDASDEGWIIADQYLEVSYSDVPEFWGIQIYTDNKAQGADPRHTGTGNPAGLVDINRTTFVLPMAWVVTDHILTKKERDDPEEFKPIERTGGEGFTSYMWHYLVDKNTKDDPNTDLDETFANVKDYIVLWNQSGLAWNEGGRAGRPPKVYVYLAANFSATYAGGSYKTSTLTFELYHGVSPFPLYIYKDAPLTMHPDEEGATLENHYAPALMNYNNKPSEPNIIMDDKYAENPHSGGHSLKIRWTGEDMPGKGAWAGVMWLEPEQEWTGGPDKGYDLRGVTHLGFWVRSDNPGASLNVFFGLDGDSCQRTPPYDLWIPLTTEWTYHIIPLLLSGTEDMSYVAGGFGIVFNEGHDGQAGSPGYTVYLDDIKFETGL